MEQNQRFAILTFPQFFDGNTLGLNIVFLPRNQNPLVSAIDGEPPLAGAAPFADAKLSFVARIVSGLSGLPGATPAPAPRPLVTAQPTQARPLFEALANQFSIINLGAQNTNANLAPLGAPVPTTLEKSVKKYLPYSYRNQFNFVAARTPNAVTDDSYHCAVRGAAPKPGFVPSPDKISWGQVFASAIRQPQLATALGMIYQTQITIGATDFAKGGWLYVDLADDSDYKAQQAIDATFVKRYAARIPVLEIGKPRSVFGAIQFPVVTVAPKGDYDELFIEAAEYDDGFAKIVHAFQPVSNSLLLEQSDGFHPTRDVGIRLGWDDEQILIWYIRQLAEDPLVGAGKRIDAPIGAFGYKVDVREDKQPPVPWESLNQVDSKAALSVVNPVTNDGRHPRQRRRQGAPVPGLSGAARWRPRQVLLAAHVLRGMGRQVDGIARRRRLGDLPAWGRQGAAGDQCERAAAEPAQQGLRAIWASPRGFATASPTSSGSAWAT